jgi:hypothetical protein
MPYFNSLHFHFLQWLILTQHTRALVKWQRDLRHFFRIVMWRRVMLIYPRKICILGTSAQNRGKRLLALSYPSTCPSVCMSAWSDSASIGQVLMRFYIWEVFENMSQKFRFHLHLTRIMVSLHGYLRKFTKICPWILLGIRNFQTKIVEESKAHIMCSINVFRNKAFFITISEAGHKWQYNTTHALCMTNN